MAPVLNSSKYFVLGELAVGPHKGQHCTNRRRHLAENKNSFVNIYLKCVKEAFHE